MPPKYDFAQWEDIPFREFKMNFHRFRVWYDDDGVEWNALERVMQEGTAREVFAHLNANGSPAMVPVFRQMCEQYAWHVRFCKHGRCERWE